ncbi:MAG: hypothetical protein ABS23_02005 [SAR92 bacterium BACL16 MAG-120619-bin48]|nr:MAG: hypothetical protein ABS23_02005 [SAR92 bacterium BACL16 MAG-120619-bin48]
MTSEPKTTDGLLFQRAQYEFAAHIRNPQCHPAPVDIEDRRLAIYRNLFFNNLQGFIANGFPILKSITAADHWTALVRDFMHRHQSQSPYFLDSSAEFLHYLEHERSPQPHDPAFLLELAHYEWVELALDISTLELPQVRQQGDVLDDCPVVSPLAWPLCYNYQVQRIGIEYQPSAEQQAITHLIVYRDRSMKVGFIETNASTARLLEIIGQGEVTGHQALVQLAGEMGYADLSAILAFGRDILTQLQGKEIICGFR